MIERRFFLVGAGSSLILAGCQTSSVLNTAVADAQGSVTESGIVTREGLGPVNAYRREKGKAALGADDTLSRLALEHAEEMAALGKMSHARFSDRMRSAGIRYSAAENVALGQPNIESVVAAFAASRGHRRNMLGDFSKMGLAVARDARSGSRPFWAMELAG